MTQTRGRSRTSRWAARAVVPLLVLAVSATAGWLAGDRAARPPTDGPTSPTAAADREPEAPTVPAGTPTEGAALTSVTATTLINRTFRQLAGDDDLETRLPRGLDAVAVQVTVTDARRPGVVRLDAGAGQVDALRIAASGTTTSNLVVLPVSGRTLSVRHRPGGGLTVRIVGTFGRASDNLAGRFVARPPVRVAHIDTAQDGRELTVPPASYGARPGIFAALVLVTAEVGDAPARLLVGRRTGAVSEQLVWGGARGAGGANTQRRGLALVPVNAAGEFSMRYEHGTALDVDVLGWFTGPGERRDGGALLVPAPSRTLYDGKVARGGADLEVPADATGALLNLAADPGVAGDLRPTDVAAASGRTLAVVVDAASGRVHLDARRPLKARVDLLGWFVDAQD